MLPLRQEGLSRKALFLFEHSAARCESSLRHPRIRDECRRRGCCRRASTPWVRSQEVKSPRAANRANESIPSPHHRVAPAPRERSIRFPWTWLITSPTAFAPHSSQPRAACLVDLGPLGCRSWSERARHDGAEKILDGKGAQGFDADSFPVDAVTGYAGRRLDSARGHRPRRLGLPLGARGGPAAGPGRRPTR